VTFLIELVFWPKSCLVDQWLKHPNWMQTLGKRIWELYFVFIMPQKMHQKAGSAMYLRIYVCSSYICTTGVEWTEIRRPWRTMDKKRWCQGYLKICSSWWSCRQDWAGSSGVAMGGVRKVGRGSGLPRAEMRRGQQSGRDNGKMVVIMTKMGVIRGHQASHDFWGGKIASPPRAPITHATPLAGS